MKTSELIDILLRMVLEYGEHVWLKPLYVNKQYEAVSPDAPEALRIGVTDCCFVSDPCERHRNMPTTKLTFRLERSERR